MNDYNLNYQIPYINNNLYQNPYNNTIVLVPYNFNQCGLITSTNPNIINNSIRGGYFSSTCIPNSNETCYCKDTCNNGNYSNFNNGWWNCTNPQNGGQGVPRYFINFCLFLNNCFILNCVIILYFYKYKINYFYTCILFYYILLFT